MGRKQVSLWSLVEKMQKKLEAEGLEHEVVDAAVTQGLETLLGSPKTPRSEPRQRLMSLLMLPTPAEA